MIGSDRTLQDKPITFKEIVMTGVTSLCSAIMECNSSAFILCLIPF